MVLCSCGTVEVRRGLGPTRRGEPGMVFLARLGRGLLSVGADGDEMDFSTVGPSNGADVGLYLIAPSGSIEGFSGDCMIRSNDDIVLLIRFSAIEDLLSVVIGSLYEAKEREGRIVV